MPDNWLEIPIYIKNRPFEYLIQRFKEIPSNTIKPSNTFIFACYDVPGAGKTRLFREVSVYYFKIKKKNDIKSVLFFY